MISSYRYDYLLRRGLKKNIEQVHQSYLTYSLKSNEAFKSFGTMKLFSF